MRFALTFNASSASVVSRHSSAADASLPSVIPSTTPVDQEALINTAVFHRPPSAVEPPRVTSASATAASHESIYLPSVIDFEYCSWPYKWDQRLNFDSTDEPCGIGGVHSVFPVGSQDYDVTDGFFDCILLNAAFETLNFFVYLSICS